MILLRLFWEYFKVGLFSIGGGMATIPFLYEISDRTGWFTHAQLMDMIAVSESTPGPIGVNMATYVGFTLKGVPGALIATLGLITPSVIVILIIAIFLKSFRNNKYVGFAFYGLRPASSGLIAAAGLSVSAAVFLNLSLYSDTHLISELFNIKALVLGAVLIILTHWIKPTKKLHPIVFIMFSAVIGVIFRFGGA